MSRNGSVFEYEENTPMQKGTLHQTIIHTPTLGPISSLDQVSIAPLQS